GGHGSTIYPRPCPGDGVHGCPRCRHVGFGGRASTRVSGARRPADGRGGGDGRGPSCRALLYLLRRESRPPDAAAAPDRVLPEPAGRGGVLLPPGSAPGRVPDGPAEV